jgi:hypothetical protein
MRYYAQGETKTDDARYGAPHPPPSHTRAARLLGVARGGWEGGELGEHLG